MEGEAPQPPTSKIERQRTPADTAADLLMDGIIKYPATDYKVGAYLSLRCREHSLNPRELSVALLRDKSAINRITIAANTSHDRSRDQNLNIPPEIITVEDIQVVARTIFEIVDELGELTTEEVADVLNHSFPGSEHMGEATLDDMRRMYVSELIQRKKDQQ